MCVGGGGSGQRGREREKQTPELSATQPRAGAQDPEITIGPELILRV